VATENIRLFAAVRGAVLHPKTRHTIGLPPELADNAAEVQQLPSPDVLLIEQESEGSGFLHRMTRSGEMGGDIWHRNIDDAKHQADYEFGALLGEWQAIPDNVTDAYRFATEAVNERANNPKSR
jgi:hypothetical protein